MQTTICRAHDRQTGQPCQNPPIANTGLCTQHGGPAVEKSIHTNTKHGAFARILPQSLTHDFQAARSDPNALSLADEIALLRTFLAHYLSTFQDNQPITAEDLDRVARHVERISRLVARQARLLAEDRDRSLHEQKTASMQQMAAVMQQVLQEFLPDPATCSTAHNRLTELIAQHDLLPAQPAEPRESRSDPLAEPASQDVDGAARPSSLPPRRQKVSAGFPLPANEVSEEGTSAAQQRPRASVGPGGRREPARPGGRLPANEVGAPLAAPAVVGAPLAAPAVVGALLAAPAVAGAPLRERALPPRSFAAPSQGPGVRYEFNLEAALREASRDAIRQSFETLRPVGPWPLLPDTRPPSTLKSMK